jgi:hypothetical protein
VFTNNAAAAGPNSCGRCVGQPRPETTTW